MQLQVYNCMKEKVPSLSWEEYTDLWNKTKKNNEKIVNELRTLMYERFEHGERFRGAAYKKAITAIKKYNIPIMSGKQVHELPGIGKKISDKIDEIIKTGKLRETESLKGSKFSVIELFKGIWGVGPATAAKWYDKGYRTLKDIEIVGLTPYQKIGLKYYHELNKKITRSQVEKFKILFEENLKLLDPDGNVHFEVVGSYSRGETEIGDIDILMTSKQGDEGNYLSYIIDSLSRKGIITDILSAGKEEYAGVILLNGNHSKLDLWAIPREQWIMQHFSRTASAEFNKRIRAHSKRKGYMLSQNGLFKKNKLIPITSDEELFETLGLKFISLEDRNDLAILK